MKIEIRPAFDETVMLAELPVRKASAKVLLLLQSLDLPQLWSHPCLNFEKLHGMVEPITGQQLYSYAYYRKHQGDNLPAYRPYHCACQPAYPT